ncbi:serine protease easter-like [Fopius arisanus]|uniref:Serine protease easter-like n=1 Tax=Fopius arisanus TaxID=64838 RepID=A0A9R1U9I6_9HYME|nr:PREDICTED: serine protease easter-like [Fopius arisanus]
MVGDLVDPGSVFYRQSWLILNRVFNATGLILGKRPTFGLFLIIFCLLLIIVINTSNIFKMFSISQVLILIFIVTKSLSQSSPDACRNPNGDVGSCINIRQCTALMNILQSRPLDPQNVRFLQESRCGFEGRDPKVCCVGQHQSVGPDSDQNGETNNGSIASRADLLPDDCGRDLSLRILGGERAEIDEFPWMVLLEYQKRKKINRNNNTLCESVSEWKKCD